MVEKFLWGTDGIVSLPKPLDSTNIEMVDMEGFCFTPYGIAVNMTVTDHEELLSSGYGPETIDPGPVQHD